MSELESSGRLFLFQFEKLRSEEAGLVFIPDLHVVETRTKQLLFGDGRSAVGVGQNGF